MRVPRLVLALVFGLVAPQAHGGEELWRECRVCHQVTAPDGTVLARGGRAAPNLHGIVGRTAAGDDGFRRYSEAMRRAGADGLVWTRNALRDYIRDPDGFLSARTGMAIDDGKMPAPPATDVEGLITFIDELSR